MRFLLPVLLLTISACSAHAPELPPPNPANAEEIWQRALQWQQDAHTPLADPSFHAAEERAIELANLAQRAAHQGMGLRARQLAAAADQTRDQLLACREPQWRIQEPLKRAVAANQSEASFVPWLRTHQAELLAGRDAGFVASRTEIRTTIAFIDRLLEHIDRRDDLLYLAPGLRDHRRFLQNQLLPNAPQDVGLHTLPGGAECHAALARASLGTSWDLSEVRSIAQKLLKRHPPSCRAATLAWPEEAAAANRGEHPLGWIARGFHPNPAIASGWRVYLHRYGEVRRPEWADRHGALLSALALGALFELQVHASPWSRAQAVEFAREHGCDRSRAIALYSRAVREPFTHTSQLVGYLSLQQLRTSVAREQGADFDNATFNNAVAEAGALPLELLQSAVRQRLGMQ